MSICWNCCDTCEKTSPKHSTKDCECCCIDRNGDGDDHEYKLIDNKSKSKSKSYSNEIEKLANLRKKKEANKECKYGLSCRYKSSCPHKHPIKKNIYKTNYFKNRMNN